MSMTNAEGDNLGPLAYDEALGRALRSALDFAERMKGAMASLGLGTPEAYVSRGPDFVQVYYADLGPHAGFVAGRRHELRIQYESANEGDAYSITATLSRLSPREALASEQMLGGAPSDAFDVVDAETLLRGLLTRLLA